jgi:hypothetical protein
VKVARFSYIPLDVDVDGKFSSGKALCGLDEWSDVDSDPRRERASARDDLRR